MHFHFPVIIIDEDFRSENASGLGIRALATAIETEGFEVLGVTSYGDLTSFAQQQEQMRTAMQKTMGTLFPFGNIEEVGRQNMAMMERAFSMFTPFYRGTEPTNPSQAHESEIEALRSEIERLRIELEAAKKR